MAPNYYVSQQVRLTLTFTVGGMLTNPGAVSVVVKAPDGTTSNPTASNAGTGVYTADFVLASKGVWRWRAFSSGAVVAAVEGEINALSDF